MIITKEQLLAIAPRMGVRIDTYLPLLNKYLPEYGICTAKEVAYFLAQVCHESLEFKVLQENLNYSQKGLMVVFPKYFSTKQSYEYERKPEKIANRVYANRYGNGDEFSGDGWKYRGRGLIQITFKDNYKAFGYESNPDILLTPEYAVKSACQYWQSRNLNKYARISDFKGLTRCINGGYNGMEEREKYRKRAETALKV